MTKTLTEQWQNGMLGSSFASETPKILELVEKTNKEMELA